MGLLDDGAPQALKGKSSGRVYPVTPDGSQWEARVHIEVDFGDHTEIVGEVVYRSFNGGLLPLEGIVKNGGESALDTIRSYITKAQQSATGLSVVPQLPPNLKNGRRH